MALTRSGAVFTWGKGDYHRLGHGTDDHVRRPRRVAALQGKKVVAVATGSLHCVACTDQGETEVHCCAMSKLGKEKGTYLSKQDVKKCQKRAVDEERKRHFTCHRCRIRISLFSPLFIREIRHLKLNCQRVSQRKFHRTFLSTSPHVKNHFCPDNTELKSAECITFSGEVFTWGDNDEGQLGDGSTNAIQRPRLVAALQGKRINRVACGSAHTLAWSTSKAVATSRLPAEVSRKSNKWWTLVKS